MALGPDASPPPVCANKSFIGTQPHPFICTQHLRLLSVSYKDSIEYLRQRLHGPQSPEHLWKYITTLHRTDLPPLDLHE